jgi:glycosyltransferase involved in cell wall biosynthesis
LTDLPLISVLIPVYNAEDELIDSIKSITNQSYTNLEIIIIDDCSTDFTAEKLLELTDNRIKIFKNECNLQIAATLNKGMQLCQGKYVARMDADDYSLPDRIMKQYLFLEKNPDYLLVGSYYFAETNGQNLGVRKQVTGYKRLRSKLLFGNNICHPSIMINREVWLHNKLSYNVSLKYAQDYDLWTRAIKECKMTNLKEPLIIYRKNIRNTNLIKSIIVNENFNNSLIVYIKSTFKDLSILESEELFKFFRRPIFLSRPKAFKLYLKSLSIIFKPDNFDKLDYFFRINNQLFKNIMK